MSTLQILTDVVVPVLGLGGWAGILIGNHLQREREKEHRFFEARRCAYAKLLTLLSVPVSPQTLADTTEWASVSSEAVLLSESQKLRSRMLCCRGALSLVIRCLDNGIDSSHSTLYEHILTFFRMIQYELEQGMKKELGMAYGRFDDVDRSESLEKFRVRVETILSENKV